MQFEKSLSSPLPPPRPIVIYLTSLTFTVHQQYLRDIRTFSLPTAHHARTAIPTFSHRSCERVSSPARIILTSQ